MHHYQTVLRMNAIYQLYLNKDSYQVYISFWQHLCLEFGEIRWYSDTHMRYAVIIQHTKHTSNKQRMLGVLACLGQFGWAKFGKKRMCSNIMQFWTILLSERMESLDLNTTKLPAGWTWLIEINRVAGEIFFLVTQNIRLI